MQPRRGHLPPHLLQHLQLHLPGYLRQQLLHDLGQPHLLPAYSALRVGHQPVLPGLTCCVAACAHGHLHLPVPHREPLHHHPGGGASHPLPLRPKEAAVLRELLNLSTHKNLPPNPRPSFFIPDPACPPLRKRRPRLILMTPSSSIMTRRKSWMSCSLS